MHKKKLYKNQVESQCLIMKDQITQVKIMQGEHANMQAKVQSQEAQINRLTAMLGRKASV